MAEVRDATRERLEAAAIDEVVERGFEAARIAGVVARAGVDRPDFDREFSDLEDCCLKAYTRNNERFDARVLGAYGCGRPWRDSLRAAAYAAARFLAEHPREVRFNVIQTLRAGGMIQAERDRYMQRLVDLIDAGRGELEDPDALSRSVAEATVGAIVALMIKGANQGGDVARAEDFVPELMYLAVRPYLGEEAAREELTIPPPPERRTPDRAARA